MTRLHFSIDRFEENQAVLQDDNGATSIVEKSLLPPDAVQGDVLVFCGGNYYHDREETIARRERVRHLAQILQSKRKDA